MMMTASIIKAMNKPVQQVPGINRAALKEKCPFFSSFMSEI
jgi:hypothetical protein